MPQLPKNFLTWLMVFLLLVLAGFVGWAYWVLGEAAAKRPGVPKAVSSKQGSETEPITPPR